MEANRPPTRIVIRVGAQSVSTIYATECSSRTENILTTKIHPKPSVSPPCCKIRFLWFERECGGRDTHFAVVQSLTVTKPRTTPVAVPTAQYDIYSAGIAGTGYTGLDIKRGLASVVWSASPEPREGSLRQRAEARAVEVYKVYGLLTLSGSWLLKNSAEFWKGAAGQPGPGQSE